jgi:hypothetical protein
MVAAIRAAEAAADEYESLDTDRLAPRWRAARFRRDRNRLRHERQLAARRAARCSNRRHKPAEAAAHFGRHGEPVDLAYAINMRAGFFSAGNDMRAAEFFARQRARASQT